MPACGTQYKEAILTVLINTYKSGVCGHLIQNMESTDVKAQQVICCVSLAVEGCCKWCASVESVWFSTPQAMGIPLPRISSYVKTFCCPHPSPPQWAAKIHLVISSAIPDCIPSAEGGNSPWCSDPSNIDKKIAVPPFPLQMCLSPVLCIGSLLNLSSCSPRILFPALLLQFLTARKS